MNILEIAQKHVTLHKSGSHFVGPCPKCGGKNDTSRFVVNTAKNFAQCYSCGGNWTVVRFLKDIEGLSCPEAHRAAETECEAIQCPVWEKCSRGCATTKKQHTAPATPSAPAPDQQAYHAGQAEPAPESWSAHALEYVNRCHARLLENPEQLAYLAGRGLDLEAVKRYRLGWIPELEYKNRKAWGLADKEKDGRTVKVLPFPQGIMIPWFQGETVHRLRIRKTVVTGPNDPRYLWVDGSGNDIICLNHKPSAHLVVESDLDGLLIDHLAGDLIGTIPLGSCSTKPKSTVMELLRSSLRILVALDYDHEQRDDKLHAPGARAAHWWYREFPDTARRWPVPVGKDPGEAYAAGCDLRAWVVKGLPIALQLKAAQQAPADNHSEKKSLELPDKGEQRGPVAQPEPEVQKITAQDGRTVYITDNREEFQRLVAQGKIVFNSRELALVKLSGADQKQAASFLDVKQIFPGAIVVSADPDCDNSKDTTRSTYRGKFVK